MQRPPSGRDRARSGHAESCVRVTSMCELQRYLHTYSAYRWLVRKAIVLRHNRRQGQHASAYDVGADAKNSTQPLAVVTDWASGSKIIASGSAADLYRSLNQA